MASASDFPSIEPLNDDGSSNERAYHGTNLEDAESIVRNGFRIGRSAQHFLGDGVYFFDDQYEEAIAWGNTHHSYRPPCAVLKSTVKYGKFLNLNDRRYSRAYGKLMNVMRTHALRRGRPISNTTVINALATELGADSIRATFGPSLAKLDPKYSTPFEVNQQMIICVRNTSKISDTQIVYPAAPADAKLS